MILPRIMPTRGVTKKSLNLKNTRQKKGSLHPFVPATIGYCHRLSIMTIHYRCVTDTRTQSHHSLGAGRQHFHNKMVYNCGTPLKGFFLSPGSLTHFPKVSWEMGETYTRCQTKLSKLIKSGRGIEKLGPDEAPPKFKQPAEFTGYVAALSVEGPVEDDQTRDASATKSSNSCRLGQKGLWGGRGERKRNELISVATIVFPYM